MQVNVDRHLEAIGQAEDEVEVPHRVAIQRARVDAAHHVGARCERIGQHLGRAGLAQQPGLREGDDLHLGATDVRLTGGQHGVQPLGPAVDVDLP